MRLIAMVLLLALMVAPAVALERYAEIHAVPDGGPAPLAVDFTGIYHGAPTDHILAYIWEVNGAPHWVKTFSQGFREPGTYTAHLTIYYRKHGAPFWWIQHVSTEADIIVTEPAIAEPAPTGRHSALTFSPLEFMNGGGIPVALEGAPVVYFVTTYVSDYDGIEVLYHRHCGDLVEDCADPGRIRTYGSGIISIPIYNPRGEIRYHAEKLSRTDTYLPMRLTVYTDRGVRGIEVYHQAETTDRILDLTFNLTAEYVP